MKELITIYRFTFCETLWPSVYRAQLFNREVGVRIPPEQLDFFFAFSFLSNFFKVFSH